MPDPEVQFFRHEYAPSKFRKIAYIKTEGSAEKPGIVWLPGFHSTMMSTKITALADWCTNNNQSLLRFDYSGHGLSEGRFEDGTISFWLDEVDHLLSELCNGPQILVGSSMGGWIALLLQSKLVSSDLKLAALVKGIVLIAPAWDMTESLMWEKFSDDIRDTIMTKGIYLKPSAYEENPYQITRALIEDGRKNLLAGKSFDPGCPVRIVHGMQDPDVPWEHSLKLLSILESHDIVLNLIKDGDHRLSRDQDIRQLLHEIETVSGLVRS